MRYIQSLVECNFSFPAFCLLIFLNYQKLSKKIKEQMERDPKLSNSVCFEISTNTINELMQGRKAENKFLCQPLYTAPAMVTLVHPAGRNTSTQVMDRSTIINTKRVAMLKRMFGNTFFPIYCKELWDHNQNSSGIHLTTMFKNINKLPLVWKHELLCIMGDYKFCLQRKFLKSFTFTNFGKKNTLKTYKMSLQHVC